MEKTILLLLLATAACRDQRPPAPSPEQSAQLNDAENMLNEVGANQAGNTD